MIKKNRTIRNWCKTKKIYIYIYIYYTAHTRASHWTSVWCITCNSAASVLEQSCMEIYPIHLTIGNESRFSLFINQQGDEKDIKGIGHVLRWNWLIVCMFKWVSRWGIVNVGVMNRYEKKIYIYTNNIIYMRHTWICSYELLQPLKKKY